MSEQAHVICTAITDVDAELLAMALFGLAMGHGPEDFEVITKLALSLGVAERVKGLAVDYRNYRRRKSAQGGPK